jgi:hypothetical protein
MSLSYDDWNSQVRSIGRKNAYRNEFLKDLAGRILEGEPGLLWKLGIKAADTFDDIGWSPLSGGPSWSLISGDCRRYRLSSYDLEKNMFEELLIKKVKEGDPACIIFANKTIDNRPSGDSPVLDPTSGQGPSMLRTPIAGMWPGIWSSGAYQPPPNPTPDPHRGSGVIYSGSISSYSIASGCLASGQISYGSPGVLSG